MTARGGGGFCVQNPWYLAYGTPDEATRSSDVDCGASLPMRVVSIERAAQRPKRGSKVATKTQWPSARQHSANINIEQPLSIKFHLDKTLQLPIFPFP